MLEATGAGSVSDGQWSLPFPTIAKIASAVSGILQRNNGVRKVTGTFMYAINLIIIIPGKGALWIREFTQCLQGEKLS